MYFMLVSSSEVARGRSSGAASQSSSVACRRTRLLRNVLDSCGTVDQSCGDSSGNDWLDYITGHGRLLQRYQRPDDNVISHSMTTCWLCSGVDKKLVYGGRRQTNFSSTKKRKTSRTVTALTMSMKTKYFLG